MQKEMTINMKRRTHNNVLKATKMLQKKGYNLEEANQIAINLFDEHENGEMPIEWYIGKIQEKIITVAERIRCGKANHQITHISLTDANTGEKIGVFTSEKDIPEEILQRPSKDDWDRGWGWL